MAFIGVDLHTNSFTICRLAADGSETFQTFHLSAQALEQFCQSLDAEDELAVEATGNTAWFCGEVESACTHVWIPPVSSEFQTVMNVWSDAVIYQASMCGSLHDRGPVW